MKRRVIVISDIHLAATPPFMMSRPDALSAFIRDIAMSRRDNERCELVIAGDFVDFLAVRPAQAFTADPDNASDKLRSIFENENRAVAEALGEAVRDGLTLTIHAGNHDLELCHPEVQTVLIGVLGLESEDRVRFIAHGQAQRVGGLLIEHGNRYDGANENDWDGARALVSSLSRGDASHRYDVVTHNPAVSPSPGSRLVAEVLDGVRSRYPFITLLQPEGILTALLLRVLEPSLSADWNQVMRLLKARQAQGQTAPGKIRNISAQTIELDEELEAAFGDDYSDLARGQSEHAIATTDWARLYWSTRDDSFSERLRRKEEPSFDILKKLQLLLRKMKLDFPLFSPDGPVGECGVRAALITQDKKIQTVVMGHTHAARSVGLRTQASYINTGTWADIVCVPSAALTDNDAGLHELRVFLERLCNDDPACRQFIPTYAEISIEGGTVAGAELHQYDAPCTSSSS